MIYIYIIYSTYWTVYYSYIWYISHNDLLIYCSSRDSTFKSLSSKYSKQKLHTCRPLAFKICCLVQFMSRKPVRRNRGASAFATRRVKNHKALFLAESYRACIVNIVTSLILFWWLYRSILLKCIFISYRAFYGFKRDRFFITSKNNFDITPYFAIRFARFEIMYLWFMHANIIVRLPHTHSR